MKKWLFNPFIYLAGTKALAIGWGIMLLTAFIGSISHTRFDGVIDTHSIISGISTHLVEQLIDWICLVIVFFPAGRLFSHSSVRFIDVAGTMAMARWVLIFAAIAGFGIDANVSAKMATLPPNESIKLITLQFVGIELLILLITIWMVALVYNAFSVSCNLKGGKAAAIFITGIILAEVISKIAISYL